MFRLHEALFFLSAQFLKSREAALLRVAGRRHGSALAIWVFCGRPGLAAGRHQNLCWSILAQGVFMGRPNSPKICIFVILLTFFDFVENVSEVSVFQREK